MDILSSGFIGRRVVNRLESLERISENLDSLDDSGAALIAFPVALADSELGAAEQ